MNTRVLVTGAGGFIDHHMLEAAREGMAAPGILKGRR